MGNKKVILAVCAIFILTAACWSAVRGISRIEPKLDGQKESTIQSVTVQVTEKGYQPSSFKLQRDVPARLTFVRETEDNCGKELVIPEYGIKRSLPLNQPVTVEFTPHKSGEFVFTCGMRMMRGKIIVS